jgi:hypothetical protein
MQDWDLLQFAALFILVVMGIRAWWRAGFWIPRYVHLAAALMIAVGYLLWRLAAAWQSPYAEVSFWLFVIGPPLAVYAVFFVYGGTTGFMRNLGMMIDYHAAMQRDDVKAIFMRYVPQFLSMRMREIHALGPSTPAIKVRRGTDRYYKLYARSEPIEDPEAGSLVAVHLRLEDHSEPHLRPPAATTQILLRPDGEVVQNPLEYMS